MSALSFIAFDWCGYNDRYGRFTHVPSYETLVCQPWMGQTDWDKAQLEWFKKYDGAIVVHRCLSGSYYETGDTLGTVEEIIKRLKGDLPREFAIEYTDTAAWKLRDLKVVYCIRLISGNWIKVKADTDKKLYKFLDQVKHTNSVMEAFMTDTFPNEISPDDMPVVELN